MPVQNVDSSSAGSQDEALPPPNTTIKTVASPDYLRAIWKKHIRKALRQHKLSAFYLATDSVQYAAYEWGLDAFLQRLGAELNDGSYSPESADVLRGAKGRGLSRPLAFLSPRDALVYHAIVSRALPDLVKELRPWTGSTKADKDKAIPKAVASDHEHVEEFRSCGSAASGIEDQLKLVEPDASIDYGNFFQRWLQKQGVVYSILEREHYVVESDVANYFTSIDLGIVQEYLLRTGLSRDVVRLLIHLVRNVLRHPQYAETPGLGLPQESIDSSRHIAHGLLAEVDREFDALGEAGLYGRFMDDFVLGAPSVAEAEKLIARLQRQLEPLGLYPNPSKTRVFSVSEYRERIMAEENAYLDQVDASTAETKAHGLRSRVLGADAGLEPLFEKASNFRNMDERPARWDRVLRRYYRYMRELGEDRWLEHCVSDLREFPDSAAHILEYVRSFPLTSHLVADLFDVAKVQLDLYGNVPLFVLETVATSPTPDTDGFGIGIADQAIDLSEHLLSRKVLPRSLEDWSLAYVASVVSKFGTEDQQHQWIDLMHLDDRPVQSVVRLHALPLQVALGTPASSVFVSEMAGLSWSSVLTLDFVRALESGDGDARGVVIGLLGPQPKLLPNRFLIHSRSLALVRIAARVPEKRLVDALDRATDRLDQNPLQLKDHVTLSILRSVKDMTVNVP